MRPSSSGLPSAAVSVSDDSPQTGPSEVRPDPILRVTGLEGHNIQQLNLDVHAGEIVGIAGVTGSGREEIAELVFADRSQGEVFVAGQLVPPGRPDLSISRGMALLPADRLSKAALRDMTLRENLTIGGLEPFYGLRGLRRRGRTTGGDGLAGAAGSRSRGS